MAGTNDPPLSSTSREVAGWPKSSSMAGASTLRRRTPLTAVRTVYCPRRMRCRHEEQTFDSDIHKFPYSLSSSDECLLLILYTFPSLSVEEMVCFSCFSAVRAFRTRFPRHVEAVANWAGDLDLPE